jgi:hypothetical protein
MSVEEMTPDEMMAAMMSEKRDVPAESVKPTGTTGPVAVQAASAAGTVIATPPTASGAESGRGDVSASTIARMMGMATAAEFKVLEGKVDLLSTKINTITGKLEKITSSLANAPTGSDLERIDVQISSLRTALNEAVTRMDASVDGAVQKLIAHGSAQQPQSQKEEE